MNIKCALFLVALAACTPSTAVAQEKSVTANAPAGEARWQKQCVDKANYDNLGADLRPTFMIECVAGAKLDALTNPAAQK